MTTIVDQPVRTGTWRLRHGGLPSLTAEECENVALGRLRFETPWPNGMRWAKLGPRALTAYREAEATHYVVDSRDAWSPAANLYFLLCEALRQPFIRVGRRGRWGTVSMDLITCRGRQLTRAAEDEVLAVLRAETAPRGHCGAGVYSSSDRVAVEHAEAIAARLWALATAPGAIVSSSGREGAGAD